MKKEVMPPNLFLRFFRWFCHPKLRDPIEGDLMELYDERVEEFGKGKADRRFIIDVLLLFRRGIIRPTEGYKNLNNYGMFKSYFKVALRNIIKNKGYSFINISGLCIGMAATMLILLWVQNEIGFDRFHEKTDRIYQMFSRDEDNGRLDVWGNTSALMAPELKQSYGEVEDAVRFRIVYFLAKAGEKHYNVAGAFADPGYLSMFSFPLIEGAKSALQDDSGVVLAEKLAVKLFGTTDCIGKTVVINDNDSFIVTGVLKAFPANTEFNFEFLVPWNYMTKLGWDKNQTWAATNAATYVLLKEGASPLAFDAKVKNIAIKHIEKGDGSTREAFSHPLSKVHLYTSAENGKLTRGRIETVQLFITIAIFILLIACINFMNLSTAKSEKRAQEVGVRKIVGAHRNSLIFQFIAESTTLALVSFVFALIIVQLLQGTFNEIVNAQLYIDWSNPRFWLFSFSFILFTGIMAGSYPAFYLSSSQPIKVLKGTFRNVTAMITPRKVLVVLQFTFAVTMIISTIIVQRQIKYAQGRDIGYNRSDLAYNFTQGDVLKHYDLIKNDLMATGAATSVSRTFSPITRIWGTMTGLTWPGSTETDKKINFLQYGVDVDFTKTIGARLLQGRDLDIISYPADSAAILLNEAAVKAMHIKDPIGETIKDETGFNWKVVGVIKDIIIESPYEEVKPMIIQGWSTRYGVVHFRLNPLNNRADNLVKAEQVFRKHNPEYPFEYYFADEFYDRKFGNEKQTRTLIALFSGLTIFISCLGLFGLAAYVAEQRTKEIGVRKVLGASVLNLWGMLSKDFVVLVIISVGISIPIAYYFMNNWLQKYEYRTEINWWIFAVAGLGALVITVFTVSYQSIKAALANPVNSLRSE
jgi:ABC-type antimicrobial peptide transport system permease subunit